MAVTKQTWIMKKVTRDLIMAAITVGGVFMAGQSTFAQAIANDLYMGFQNQAGGGTEDYIINLGPASGIVGGSSVVTLSSDFSSGDFNAVLGTSSSLFGGVVGASNAGNPSDVYATQLRTGGAGTPSVPGSTAPAGLSKTDDNTAFSKLATLFSPAAGTGGLDTSKSWESDVEPTFTTASFYGVTGVNPDSVVSKTNVLYEDLWYTSSSSLTGGPQPFVYEGYFTLNLTGGSPVLTFTPKGVPGPLQSPVFTSISKAAGTVTLVWTTMTNHTYQLQYTASLSPTNWMNVGSALLATNTMMTNSDSPGAAPQRLYRITAQ